MKFFAFCNSNYPAFLPTPEIYAKAIAANWLLRISRYRDRCGDAAWVRVEFILNGHALREISLTLSSCSVSIARGSRKNTRDRPSKRYGSMPLCRPPSSVRWIAPTVYVCGIARPVRLCVLVFSSSS